MTRILIIKTSSLGDVVHNLPIVADIRSHRPGAVMDWVVEESFAGVLTLHPHIRRIIPAATRRWRRALFRPVVWREMRKFMREIQDQEYDMVLDTQGLLKSAVIARLARGPSYGQDKRSAREKLAASLYGHVFPIPRGRHAVERNRDLAAQALNYPFPRTPPDYGIRVPQASFSFAIPEKFIIGLHATSRASKRWPVEHWVALGRELEGRGIALLLPWGSAEEEPHARRIAQPLKNATVLPRLNLRELAALMGRAQAVVGVDTGLVHLAAALGRPTVALYADTSPLLTGVYPAAEHLAVNLGDVGRIPAPGAALAALQQLKVL